jgi:hypothetical protein
MQGSMTATVTAALAACAMPKRKQAPWGLCFIAETARDLTQMWRCHFA